MVEIALQAHIQGLRTALESQLSADQPAARSEQLPWRAGERVTGVVEALRAGDRALLRVGTFLFDVELAPGSKPGDRLDLRFVAAAPRATFALAEPTEGALARTPVEISPAARSLSALVRGVAPDRPQQPSPVHDPLPLLPSPPRDAAGLAAALQRSLETSGLFYESHLARWASGERELASLRQEPQARFAARPDAAPAVPAESAPAAEAGKAPDAGKAIDAAKTMDTGPALRAPVGNAAAETIDQRVAAQVRAQVESLDARQIVWQGQAWPGQPLEWRVDEPPDDAREPDAPRAWTSHLRLTLPRLGEVVAELTLSGDALRLRLGATDPASRAALSAGQAELGTALELGHIRLTGFSVHE